MVGDIVANVVAGIVCAILAHLARKVFSFLTEPISSSPEPPKPSKRLVRNQFLLCLFAMLISLPAGVLLVPSTPAFVFAKIFLFLVAGFSFVFAWGAFDAAFAFYPDDDPGNTEPPQQESSQT